jgi:hypothetical protein
LRFTIRFTIRFTSPHTLSFSRTARSRKPQSHRQTSCHHAGPCSKLLDLRSLLRMAVVGFLDTLEVREPEDFVANLVKNFVDLVGEGRPTRWRDEVDEVRDKVYDKVSVTAPPPHPTR